MNPTILETGLFAIFLIIGLLAFSIYLFKTELWSNFKAWLDEEEDTYL